MINYPQKILRGKRKPLVLDDTRLVIHLDRRMSVRSFERAVGRAKMTTEHADFESLPKNGNTERARRRHALNEAPNRIFVRATPGEHIANIESVQTLSSEIGRDFGIAAPVYRVQGTEGDEGLVSPLPGVLLVRFEAEMSDRREAAALRKLAALDLVEDQDRSDYLAPFRCFRVRNPKRAASYELFGDVSGISGVVDARYELMPYLKPTTLVPNDTLYGSQWSMPQIDAEAAWDLTIGHESIVVAVLDEGCDLTHPDLEYASDGTNLGSMSGTGAPTGDHGTPCAGIISAPLNSSSGIAGLAGGCRILPIAFSSWSDAECAAGIRYAVAQGAGVLSMSFGVYDDGEGIGPIGWDFDLIDPALEEAHEAGVVLCAATGNEDINTFNRYPARHALVIAVGGSSTDDDRKTTSSPDGETWWGANWAPGVSVVAPCVLIPSCDRQGSAGYNSSAGSAGDYVLDFNGTSSATPHVAALAALCQSTHPLAGNRDVQAFIERNADKVGSMSYATDPAFPSGTRNQAMGHGRINARSTVEHAVSHYAALHVALFC